MDDHERDQRMAGVEESPEGGDATEKAVSLEYESEGAEGEEGEEGEGRPKITLDRYLSKRRNPSKSSLTHIVAMIVMLIMLVLVIVYKDRCGNMVSGVMGDMAPPSGEEVRPPVRLELQQPQKKP